MELTTLRLWIYTMMKVRAERLLPMNRITKPVEKRTKH
jgi:hypothetical protein